MLRLTTPWGLYILSNATKIDLYVAGVDSCWEVFLSIDGYKHLIHTFEDKLDAHFFVNEMKTALDDILDKDMGSWDFEEIYMDAYKKTEVRGMS